MNQDFLGKIKTLEASVEKIDQLTDKTLGAVKIYTDGIEKFIAAEQTKLERSLSESQRAIEQEKSKLSASFREIERVAQEAEKRTQDADRQAQELQKRVDELQREMQTLQTQLQESTKSKK